MNTYDENIIKSLAELNDEELERCTFRADGATTRLCDELVQNFFSAPCGEWIPVRDHYPTKLADRMLLDKFMRRMGFEHPGIEIDCDRMHMRVRRKNKTYHELVMEAINRRKNGQEL